MTCMQLMVVLVIQSMQCNTVWIILFYINLKKQNLFNWEFTKPIESIFNCLFWVLIQSESKFVITWLMGKVVCLCLLWFCYYSLFPQYKRCWGNEYIQYTYIYMHRALEGTYFFFKSCSNLFPSPVCRYISLGNNNMHFSLRAVSVLPCVHFDFFF